MLSRSRNLRRVLALVLALASAACSDDSSGTDEPGNGPFSLSDDLEVVVTPTSLAFPELAVGGTSTQVIQVSHIGSAGALTLDVGLETQSRDLTIASGFGAAELAPGESLSIEVRFTPTDGVQDSAQVQIQTNVPNASGGTKLFKVPVATLAPRPFIVLNPSLLDFGPVPDGTTRFAKIRVQNIGSLGTRLASAVVEGEDAAEFTLGELSLPADLAPEGELLLEVTYAPVGRDSDRADVRLTFEGEGAPDPLVLQLFGHEIFGVLGVAPNPIDFGLRDPEVTHEETLTLSNGGELELVVTAVEVVPGDQPGAVVEVAELPAGGLVIAPGAERLVTVSLTMAEGVIASGAPLATLVVDSTDPDGVVEVPVFGKRAGAGLEVVPADLVYFGFVGVGGAVRRPVTLYNAGPTPITVDRLVVGGNFEIAERAGWGPTAVPSEAAVLAPGDFHDVHVLFENEGGDWSAEWGKLTIFSNDVVKPEWEVLLNARSAEYAPCTVQFVPDQLDFGFVEEGGSVEQRIEVRNIGKRTCGFAGAVVDDCATPEACGPVTTDGSSAMYEVVAMPEIAEGNLASGEAWEFTVRFTAPAATAEILHYAGRLTVRATSVDPQSGETTLTALPHLAWGEGANLDAFVATGQLAMHPPELDFGIVPIDCQSAPRTMTATNVGPAAVTVTGWELVGCSQAVELVEGPTPGTDDEPLVVAPGGGLDFVLVYTPSLQTAETCSLAVRSTSAVSPTEGLVVAEGSFTGTRTDIFTELTTQVVDVLFVVDDSGSMGSEQLNLARSFDAFINTAAQWQSDYQIGVTTTTIDFPTGGELRGTPSFVTAANWEKFLHNVGVGTVGSGTEQGLWASEIALSSPLVDPTDDPCELDSDCDFFHVCGSDGLCGGPNKGFIRDGAALEIVFVSDEEDQSPKQLEGYLNFYKGLKGYDRPDLLHVHAIVGPPGGCSGAGGSAEAGHRYLEMAEATGGIAYSICELDFAKGLEGIGEIAFSAKQEWFLTQRPAPPSIQVTVGGAPCPLISGEVFNWSYNPEQNSLTLLEGGLCVAQPGDSVEIEYELLCYQEADSE